MRRIFSAGKTAIHERPYQHGGRKMFFLKRQIPNRCAVSNMMNAEYLSELRNYLFYYALRLVYNKGNGRGVVYNNRRIRRISLFRKYLEAV